MSESLRIMLVEDDPVVAEIVQMTLEDLGGFQVSHFFGGQDAIDALDDVSPDVVLMDVMMPGMDGLSSMLHIHKIPKYSALPIIFMTAKTQAHEQASYIEKGAIGVIPKPFNPETLCSTVQSLYDAHKA